MTRGSAWHGARAALRPHPRAVPTPAAVRSALVRAGRPLLALVLVAPALAGCRTVDFGGAGEGGSFTAPTYRAQGPRLPAVSGLDPSARGWTKVDDLLWIEAEHLEPHRQGLVFDGRAFVPRARAVPVTARAENGFRLRTDHVLLRTNVPWPRAVQVAAAAEAHAQRLIATYGDRLDLRLPEGPLPVTLIARRSEFEARLRGLVSDPVTWGAFYDSRTGIVTVCDEPASRGALPLEADLRHEMTHQIVDLSRPASRRGHSFGAWFWLWEGIAIHAERLGDPPGVYTSRERTVRFARRLANREVTPLAQLIALDVTSFEGRHYDQTAVLMAFLLEDASPWRETLLDVLAALVGGRDPGAAGQRLRRELPQIEESWLATLVH